MTENTNTFAARLRELIHASSLPPWEASGEVIYDPVAAIGEMYDGANADFVVYLRNHADRLADLVERVEAMLNYVPREGDTTVRLGAVKFIDVRTALDALGGGE